MGVTNSQLPVNADGELPLSQAGMKQWFLDHPETKPFVEVLTYLPENGDAVKMGFTVTGHAEDSSVIWKGSNTGEIRVFKTLDSVANALCRVGRWEFHVSYIQ